MSNNYDSNIYMAEIHEMDRIMADEAEIYMQLVPDREPVFDPETEDFMTDEHGQVVMTTVDNSSLISVSSHNQFYSAVQGRSVVIPHDAHEGYADVTGLDPKLSESCQLYIEYEDDVYQGLTWYTIGSTGAGTILAMMGIRVSLANIISGRRGTARKIIDAMLRLCGSHGCRYLVVVWPLASMVPLLEKLHFTESEDPRFTSVTRIMVSSPNHYYLDLAQ